MSQKKTFKNPKHETGLTIAELLVTVTIAIILVGFVLSKVPGLWNSVRSNGESSELQGIISGAQRVVSLDNNWSGVTLDTLIRNEAFPKNRVTVPASGAATATNRFGGSITYASGTITTTGDIGRLVYMNIPDAECKTVILNNSDLLRRVYVDKANSGTAGAGTMVKADRAAVDKDALGTSCSGGANSITYDIAK